MLVLSRKIDEEVIIDNDVVVRVISVQNGVVKLGFNAPQNKVILRGELKSAIVSENKKASVDINDYELIDLGEILKSKHK